MMVISRRGYRITMERGMPGSERSTASMTNRAADDTPTAFSTRFKSGRLANTHMPRYKPAQRQAAA